MMYLDLGEAPTLFDDHWLWSVDRPALAWFRRGDYLEPHARPLDEVARDRCERELGFRPAGPVRLLTHLRYFGYSFNPVSFYYFFDASGSQVEAILAEITNTPWGERKSYLIDARTTSGRFSSRRFAKVFHISPFLPMDLDYAWRFTTPGPRLFVDMDLARHGSGIFRATMSLRRKEISSRNLAWCLARYPLMSAQVITRIYFEALRLTLKGASRYQHPGRAELNRPTETTL